MPQVNNSPRPNVFPAEVANFGKAMYPFFVSVPRKVNPGHPGWIFFEFEQITANYHETSNFVEAIKTTNKSRVSFIDLYLIFPTNFRIVFLPHTNTLILLEPYCGTITQPGLPVITCARFGGQDFPTGKNFSFNQCHTKSFAFFLEKVIL